MSDLEKELVEKLAKALRIALDKPYSFCVLVQRELLPLIHSHTQALVAAAYAACAEHRVTPMGICSCGFVAKGGYAINEEIWREHIHSLTPADAARELERREDALIRECNDAWIQEIGAYLHIHGFDLDVVLKGVRERLASLSKPAPVERSNENG